MDQPPKFPIITVVLLAIGFIISFITVLRCILH